MPQATQVGTPSPAAHSHALTPSRTPASESCFGFSVWVFGGFKVRVSHISHPMCCANRGPPPAARRLARDGCETHVGRRLVGVWLALAGVGWRWHPVRNPPAHTNRSRLRRAALAAAASQTRTRRRPRPPKQPRRHRRAPSSHRARVVPCHTQTQTHTHNIHTHTHAHPRQARVAPCTASAAVPSVSHSGPSAVIPKKGRQALKGESERGGLHDGPNHLGLFFKTMQPI